MKTVTHCIVYKLHKDNSPVVIDCYSKQDQDQKLTEIVNEGYENAYRATPEQANDILRSYGERFNKPKVLTQQERWENWALGI